MVTFCRCTALSSAGNMGNDSFLWSSSVHPIQAPPQVPLWLVHEPQLLKSVEQCTVKGEVSIQLDPQLIINSVV